MPTSASSPPTLVIKAQDLAGLNHLARGYPRPTSLTWINRGTDQVLRPTTVAMLVRTLFRETTSSSVRKLHEESGLRVSFSEQKDRDRFASQFADALKTHRRRMRGDVTAVFERPDSAENCFTELVKRGVRNEAISILWRTGQFMEEKHDAPPGHTRLSVAAATAGGGLAGAIFGIAVLAAPGVGLLAVGGAVAVQAVSTIAAYGGAIGATGGALARMLSDIDVDDREVPFFEMQIQSGKVFISVDPTLIAIPVREVREVMQSWGGTFSPLVDANANLE